MRNYDRISKRWLQKKTPPEINHEQQTTTIGQTLHSLHKDSIQSYHIFSLTEKKLQTICTSCVISQPWQTRRKKRGSTSMSQNKQQKQEKMT